MMLKLENTFWGYTKAQFDNDENLKPSFNKLAIITSKKFLKLPLLDESLQSQAGLQSSINRLMLSMILPRHTNKLQTLFEK